MSRPKGSKNKKTLEREKQALLNTLVNAQDSAVAKVCADNVLLGATVDVTDSVSSLSEVEAN